ncbi:hypothetical protein G7077_01470 [Sphingomonas piscis]|uniref:Uncharacterized protein n=1 Tax=Sphingomonas piscis TaxID=2714943 RepID=A0A6G7YM16_9SPHN|nr:hypothetical protein [Sphingomonas piscis]QIK77781.1 hypothetical protein G7077_01470 [Sphingomonas piscis]
MSRLAALIFRAARQIAGRKRSEWIDAMEAEAATLRGNSAPWAWGCLWSAIRDRAARDWWIATTLFLFPIILVAWRGYVFFSTASLLNKGVITDLAAVGFWIVSPFPLVLLLALLTRGTSGNTLIITSFLAMECFNPVMMWIYLDVSPLVWLGPNANWYKADPGITIKPLAGILLDGVVWFTAAWIGSRLRIKLAKLG